MPELPEVEALIEFLRQHAVGQVVAKVDIATISVLKTYDPPITALGGLTVTGVSRHGKFVDLDIDGLHLIMHLARAGWLRWSDEVSPRAPRPGRGPLAMRVRFASGAGFDLTEAGTKKRLAAYLVRDPAEVAGVARLGVDPLSEEFTVERFATLLQDAGRAQVKGTLRDQSIIAGIGNAYSDEVLHVAKFSPFHASSTFTQDEVERLYRSIVETLRDAVGRSQGLAVRDLKDAKRAGMRVHGRAGQACPECGDTVREVSFADSSLQYCATCQTKGKPLADRRLSRLLK